LPAIIQTSPLSETVSVELLLNAPAKDGERPPELAGLDAIVRSGKPDNLASLISDAVVAAQRGQATAEPRSEDPATRLEQLIEARIGTKPAALPKPIAIIVSGNIDAAKTFTLLDQKLGQTAPGRISEAPTPKSGGSKIVREKIAKPLSQGGIGYVVEGPAPGTKQALAWRMLLYILTHDYSGRLGRSAITEKGLVYHIYSSIRTNGKQTWATIWTGVDPDKADATERELRAQLARLASQPPSAEELDAARSHLLGRDLTAAQSNEELTSKLSRNYVETGGLRSHEQLNAMLQAISPAELATAAQKFGNGTVIRVDVGAP
jgi:zinc protease